MPQFRLPLGVEVEDMITGFKGTITGRVEYLTGCHQYLVVSKVKKDGSGSLTGWYDDGRLKQTSKSSVKLHAGAPNGPDIPAPVR